MKDVLVLALVAGLVLLACSTLAKQRKKGIKCMGCPMAKSCAQKKQQKLCE